MTSEDSWRARSDARADALARSATEDVAAAAGRLLLATALLVVVDVVATIAGIVAGIVIMATRGSLVCVGSLCAQTSSSHPLLIPGALVILAAVIGGLLILVVALQARLAAKHRLYIATNGRRTAYGRH
ncbi:MAG: hypothetical protein M3O28_11225 [Actinomycetota bacterium]|nr:hypothetical protein [Actinomycetota bacterium]